MRFRRLAILAVLGSALALPMARPRDANAEPSVAAERSWLGLSMDPDASAGAGVRVGHVVRGSPAEHAGLRKGDRVLRVGVTRVVTGVEVVRAVAGHAVGEALDIAYVRGTSVEQRARAVLAPFPSSDDMMRMDLVGTFAPAWRNVQGVSGTFPSSMSALRGHVVLIDFWATWCVPCRVVMSKLSALHGRYGAQGLSVVGVSTEDVDDVALFAKRSAVPYAIGVDTHAETTQDYGVSSLPTLVIIDKRGVVRDVSVGYDPSEDARLEATLRSLLAEAPPRD